MCSAQNWRYAAKQFAKAYPSEVIVHCEFSVYNVTFRLPDRVDYVATDCLHLPLIII